MIIESLNILFVDDVTFYKSLLTSHLDALKIKYTIQYKTNVADGLKLLDESMSSDSPINFVISDFHMPGMSGLDLTKNIRDNTQYKNVPIMIMTSDSEKTNILNCITAGADAYVIKPWEIEQLVEGLNLALKKHDIQITKA